MLGGLWTVEQRSTDSADLLKRRQRDSWCDAGFRLQRHASWRSECHILRAHRSCPRLHRRAVLRLRPGSGQTREGPRTDAQGAQPGALLQKRLKVLTC